MVSSDTALDFDPHRGSSAALLIFVRRSSKGRSALPPPSQRALSFTKRRWKHRSEHCLRRQPPNRRFWPNDVLVERVAASSEIVCLWCFPDEVRRRLMEKTVFNCRRRVWWSLLPFLVILAEAG